MKGHPALVSTGGTIASRTDPSSGLLLPVLSGTHLLEGISFGDGGQIELEVHEFCQVASPLMTPRLWADLRLTVQALLDRDDICGVVITHGTATLEETAWFLDLTLRSVKPVVMTGAQRNAGIVDADGPRNLRAAIDVCMDSGARNMGVVIVMNDRIHAARDASKTHTVDVGAFQSGERGCLGSVFDRHVRFHRQPLRKLHLPLMNDAFPVVEIVSVYPGAGDTFVRAAMDAGVTGLVLQAISAGHVTEAVYAAVLDALRGGMRIVVSSRVPYGGTRVSYGFAGSSQHLFEAGAIFSGELSAWKARIVLMIALQNPEISRKELAIMFS